MFGIFNKVKSLFVAADKDGDGHIADDIAREVVEEVKEVAQKVRKSRKQLQAMTKKQLEEFGRELGVELDRRLTKAKLIAQVEKEQGKGE